jgi:hypothetical protein
VTPTARPVLPSAPAPWLLNPAEIAAINAHDALLDALRRGELPDCDDRDPVAAFLVAFLAEVANGGSR